MVELRPLWVRALCWWTNSQCSIRKQDEQVRKSKAESSTPLWPPHSPILPKPLNQCPFYFVPTIFVLFQPPSLGCSNLDMLSYITPVYAIRSSQRAVGMWPLLMAAVTLFIPKRFIITRWGLPAFSVWVFYAETSFIIKLKDFSTSLQDTPSVVSMYVIHWLTVHSPNDMEAVYCPNRSVTVENGIWTKTVCVTRVTYQPISMKQHPSMVCCTTFRETFFYPLKHPNKMSILVTILQISEHFSDN